MKKNITILSLLAACLIPATTLAATIDASLIPDGTYTVKVEKIVDSRHITVAMDNGAQTTLGAGRPTVDFSKVKPNDSIKCSIIKGSIVVFLDTNMTAH